MYDVGKPEWFGRVFSLVRKIEKVSLILLNVLQRWCGNLVSYSGLDFSSVSLLLILLFTHK